MKHTPLSRRDFLKNLGIAGAGTLLAASPWLSAFSEVTNTSNEKCRLAIIGPGSRGRFLMGFLAKNPKVEIVALCDIYKPSIESALELVPNAKVYGDYREVLEDKSIDAILVATPISSHCKIVLDAFDAGKHVFCEKSIGFTMEECSPPKFSKVVKSIIRECLQCMGISKDRRIVKLFTYDNRTMQAVDDEIA